MITADEVKKAARNKGFPAGVIEKDYAHGFFMEYIIPNLKTFLLSREEQH